MPKRLADRQNLTDGLVHGIMSAGAALIAYLPTQALGLREGFWAAITAITVVQNALAEVRASARDQFVGATIGGSVGVVVSIFAGQHLASFALAVILAMVLCSMLNLGSAARLAGITATIILLVPHQGSAQTMMVSRIAEVGWGVCVAIVVVWFTETARTKLAFLSSHRQRVPRG
ncbi:MAG: FUSC family protein [Rhodopila sp.]|nr:FUSC family protein [Rhodopila sp.]